eukprot:TRINITY_DN10045_c0_g1_i1.p1 TRINITY_DN10045_c0_g1~~TRINITY_DN10045_c0_g1_i1.p1  ORF type:complete len:407 (+),score=165.58 TRINITY_DN10045_c0_g1_i1:103-1323(+)
MSASPKKSPSKSPAKAKRPREGSGSPKASRPRTDAPVQQDPAALPTQAKSAGRKVAFITGITGQDGSYLAELLLEKGYDVHGIIRRSSSFNTARIDHIYGHKRLFLHYGDMCDSTCLQYLVAQYRPHEIYNLAAQSHVKVSFEMPEYTAQADGVGVLKLLEAIRSCGMEKHCKLYQASTSELYGKVQEIPQKETTPFYPRSPYAVAKLYGYWIVVNYRESYEMYACNGILFNHESPRRGGTFVTQKIVRAACHIKMGMQSTLSLGNLEAKRDWGHAKDYVRGMWMILQHPEPRDFVLATGEQHSVRSFVEKCFSHPLINMPIAWKGKRGSAEEVGVLATDHSRVLVKIDPRYFRPAEVETLLGDPKMANEVLGWKPEISYDGLVDDMLQAEMDDIERGAAVGNRKK